jgi:hypothetical protein
MMQGPVLKNAKQVFKVHKIVQKRQTEIMGVGVSLVAPVLM